MSLIVSKTYVVGEPATAQDLNGVNDEIEAALGSLTSQNLARDAGIQKEQLADRYTVAVFGPFLVVPVSADDDFATPVATEIPATPETFFEFEVPARLGQQLSLCEVQVMCLDGDATNVPQLSILKNSDPLGGSEVELSNTTRALFRLRNPNPFDAPLAALRDGDVIEVQLGRASGAGTATCRGVWVTLVCKAELLA